ncbi:hypothetical protein DBB29_08745 [Pandoraea cepalis]|uniref:Uncharacterized protein n=1 Tax=Pandoraea cepalis TaxID=2508294 RepID=A0AAW7MLK4_9BURK|nr:hypothetical protein [Pandoraea cepalis]MDN4573661.1 hypothetical protein [Pandoraea cepalis]MDN4578203.1 hypothetical protein [Pandoraea cepalis]
MTNRNTQADREPFKRMNPESRAVIQSAVDQVYACAMLTAFMLQPDDEEPAPMIVDDHRDRYGYPADWDHEVPQSRKRLDPAGTIEAMLRDTACSSDELDTGLFEGIDHD